MAATEKLLRRRACLAGLAAAGGVAAAGLARARPAASGMRQDCRNVSPERLAVLAAAIGEMQRRSAANPTDPAGWLAHTGAHALACSGKPQQVHGTWWFLPWHRAFLIMTERKLQAISGDPTLRLPYWNWTSERHIPAPYAIPGSPLSNARRFTPTRALRGSEVDCPANPQDSRPGLGALAAPSFLPASLADIPNAFGGAADPSPAGWHGRSRLEGVPHASIHNFVGGEAADGALGDMTELSTAARDPVFYAHHANLDRIWEIWRADPEHRATEPDGHEFTRKEFVFSGLDGLPAIITVAETLDTARLGYGYDTLAIGRRGDIVGRDGPLAAPPVASKTLLASALGPDDRARLTIRGALAAERPMSLEVTLAPADDPAAAVSAGAIAMGRAHGTAEFPDTEWVCDVTWALRSFGPRRVTVAIHPLALGTDTRPAPLPVIDMMISTTTSARLYRR